MQQSKCVRLVLIVFWTTMAATRAQAGDFGALRTQPPDHRGSAAPLFLNPRFHDWVERLAPNFSFVGRAEARAPDEPDAASEPERRGPAGDKPGADQRSARRAFVQRGLAAWYQHPGVTASGERYNPDGLTAAHADLPLGSRVQVINEATGRSVVVRVNDRISAKSKSRKKLAIELSRGGAREIGLDGVAHVSIYREE